MEEEQAFMEITEAIRNLQAAQIAQTRVLRAIISSHPDPASMREAWRQFSAPSIAQASTSVAIDPERHLIHEAVRDALQSWDERLARDLPDAEHRPG